MMVVKYNLTVYALNGNYPHPNELIQGSTQTKHNTTSKFDVQIGHGIFNETILRQVMQPDSVYVATLRQPFYQYRSFFYFRHMKIRFQEAQQKFIESLNINAKTEKFKMRERFQNAMFSYFNFNTQEALMNHTYFRHCLEHLAGFFHTIIAEYYDESLLLLKEDLCWDIKDIIYISHKNASFRGKDRTPEMYGSVYELHKNISHLDYALYEYFLQLHRQKVRQAGEGFQKKLMLYQKMKARVTRFCWIIYNLLSKKVPSTYSIIQTILGKTKFINGQNIFKSFTISAKECVALSLCELDFKKARLAINYPISCLQKVPNIRPGEQFCIGRDANSTDMFHYKNLHFPLSNLQKLLQCDLYLLYN